MSKPNCPPMFILQSIVRFRGGAGWALLIGEAAENLTTA